MLLKLKPEEFVCLKAIILLNSGAFSFCTGSSSAGSSSGPRGSGDNLMRIHSAPGVLQYGGSRSDCAQVL
uniref:Estrogen receptor alpha variant 11 n=1 Tax=Fundulus heteroclitus TaxID=8078 RepID=A0A068F7Q5_FUNHE|nr:estrogen receptor alpha variant 11 [Fundulus heteroclitus]